MNEFIAWFKRAQKDLKAAEHSFTSKDYEWACFQVQQSVEKTLKALLIKKTHQFQKVHDLVELAKICHAPEEIILKCGKINPFYIETRYPELSKDYSKEDVTTVIHFGKDILQWIEKNL